MLANWPAAMHCMDHFKKSSWAGGSLQINWGLAIPQATRGGDFRKGIRRRNRDGDRQGKGDSLGKSVPEGSCVRVETGREFD